MDTKLPDYVKLDRHSIVLDEFGIHAWPWMKRYTMEEPWSPIFGAEFSDFAHLGFFVWCPERLVALGFLAHEDDEANRSRIVDWSTQVDWPFRNALYSDQFVCRSVMSASQVAAMEERRARWWTTRFLIAPRPTHPDT